MILEVNKSYTVTRIFEADLGSIADMHMDNLIGIVSVDENKEVKIIEIADGYVSFIDSSDNLYTIKKTKAEEVLITKI